MSSSLSNDAMTTWQPDLFQRYELLRRILVGTFQPTPSEPIRVVDVGSGPERLSERALGDNFEVTRTDAGDFDDPEIIKIIPGAPLPFADDSADVVIAMDVVEHVPGALRQEFIEECARVARTLVVLACPTESDDVSQSEREAGRAMAHFAGRPVDFLEEHAAYGLPPAPAITSALRGQCPDVATLSNAPLETWSSANVIDFVLNLRAGPDGLSPVVNQAINEASVVCPAQEPGYRTFFLGSPSGEIDVLDLAASLVDGPSQFDRTGMVGLAIEALASSLRCFAPRGARTPSRDARSCNAASATGQRSPPACKGQQR